MRLKALCILLIIRVGKYGIRVSRSKFHDIRKLETVFNNSFLPPYEQLVLRRRKYKEHVLLQHSAELRMVFAVRIKVFLTVLIEFR